MRIPSWAWLALSSVAVTGCGVTGPVLADELIEAPGASGEGRGDASFAINGVRGAGENAGSLDVYSLAAGDEAYLVLGFSGRVITNGPGPELAVFENPFRIAGGSYRFMDPLVVEVSRDGETWVAFPHDYTAPDPSRWSPDPSHWVGFAGVSPVLLHEEDAPGDPFDGLAAGGDRFDLDALPEDDAEARAIRSEGFRYVRLVSAQLAIDPDTGAAYPHDPVSDGPDVDGVYALLR